MVFPAALNARLGTLLAALLAVSLPVSAPLSAAGPDERAWRDVRSANFRIKGVLTEQRTIELLRHLEIMRATLGDSDEMSTWRSGMPIVIVALDDHDDYVSVGAPANSAGFFFSDLRENAILIQDTAESSGIQVILHEYAHYLSKQSGRVRYPRWYEEGRAEYLSHSRLGNNTYEYALAPSQHIASLNFATWLPLRTVLDVTDTSDLDDVEASLYYAQSWLLVHYLHAQPGADGRLPQQMRDYARQVSAGTAPIEAFEAAFELEADQLENALLRYYLNRDFESRTLPADTALPGFSASVTAMTPAEARLVLARMALRFDNVDGAERWFLKVLDDDELRAHAEAGLGRVAGHRGDVDAANERFEAAIHLMSWDFTIWMDYAQYWAQRVSTSIDEKERDRHASRLIESLENALTIAEATPELNSLMGFAYLAKGRDPHEAIEFLEAAAAAAPHDQASRLLLANAYLYVGRLQDAVEVAESVLRFEHKPGLVTAAAQDVIGQARARGVR